MRGDDSNSNCLAFALLAGTLLVPLAQGCTPGPDGDDDGDQAADAGLVDEQQVDAGDVPVDAAGGVTDGGGGPDPIDAGGDSAPVDAAGGTPPVDAAPPDPQLAKSAFVFVERVGDCDHIRAYDTESDAAWLVTDLDEEAGSCTQVAGLALSPDRRRIAFSATFRPSALDLAYGVDAEYLWSVRVDGKDFVRLSPTETNPDGKASLLVAIPDVTFSPGGAEVFCTRMETWTSSGGELEHEARPWAVSTDGGGDAKLHDLNPSCDLILGVAIASAGTRLAAIQDKCSPTTWETAFTYQLSGSTSVEGQLYSNLTEIWDRPVWWPGDTVVLANARAWWDLDGDGAFEHDSSGIVVGPPGGDAGSLLPPTPSMGPDDRYEGLALAPGAETLVFGYEGNLYKIDPTAGDPASTRTQLTFDGASRRPAWRY